MGFLCAVEGDIRNAEGVSVSTDFLKSVNIFCSSRSLKVRLRNLVA